jgi:hypothetical protein
MVVVYGGNLVQLKQRSASLRDWAFMPAHNRFVVGARRLSRAMRVLMKKVLRMEPREKEFAPQRMCPFCGLITPRHKRHCLECGKSLKPA